MCCQVEKDGEEDEDEWEDASDGDEGSDSGHDSRGDEKKDTGKEKADKVKASPTSPTPRSRPTSGGSPKEQRTPRPKVHIPAPQVAQESAEGGKPLSPFSPLDGHQPVSDWGEEMEMQSPRSSMGGESPLKPPGAENSPPQKEEEETERSVCSGEAAGSPGRTRLLLRFTPGSCLHTCSVVTCGTRPTIDLLTAPSTRWSEAHPATLSPLSSYRRRSPADRGAVGTGARPRGPSVRFAARPVPA